MRMEFFKCPFSNDHLSVAVAHQQHVKRTVGRAVIGTWQADKVARVSVTIRSMSTPKRTSDPCRRSNDPSSTLSYAGRRL